MSSSRICRALMDGVSLQGESWQNRIQELANADSDLVANSSEYLSPLFGGLCDGGGVIETPMDESNGSGPTWAALFGAVANG